MTRTWGGSAIGGDIVLELTPSFFFFIYFNYYKITANFLVFDLDILGLHSFMNCELIVALLVLRIDIPLSLSLDYHSQVYSMHDLNR